MEEFRVNQCAIFNVLNTLKLPYVVENKSDLSHLVLRLPFTTKKEAEDFKNEIARATCWVLYSDNRKKSKDLTDINTMRCKRNCSKVKFNFPDGLLKGFPEIDKICSAADATEQINLLKQMKSVVLENSIEDKYLEFIKALFLMLYDAPSNSSLKKALNRIVNEISEKYPSAIMISLQQNLELVLGLSVETNTNNDKTISYITSLIEDLQAGKDVINQLYDKVWQYISFVFLPVVEELKEKNSLIRKNELFSTSLNILKFIIHSLQACGNLRTFLESNNDENFQSSSLDIKTCIKYLLVNVETTLNCRLNAAFALCHLHYYSFGGTKLKEDFLIDSPDQYPLTSQLCIYSGIMAVLPIQDIVESACNYMIAEKIILDNLHVSASFEDSEVLLLCGKNILQWTNLMCNILSNDFNADENHISSITKLFKEKCLTQKLFEYVLHNREHFIDNLRHLSRDIFKNIINIHLSLCEMEPRESPVLKDMTIYLLRDLPSHKRGKYALLCCLVEKLGTHIILEWHSTLPYELYETIVDYSLVPHVSELFNALFSFSVELEADEINSEESFDNIWLKPLLKVMCDGSKEQIRGINEYILPKLLQKKASCLSYLLSELSKMWESGIGNSFISFVICMKLHQKNTHSLNYLEFMSHESFLKAFFHADDQVRLAAFSLVCENCKSTEPVNSRYFELIKSGLCYSMDCQSPSFRQQLISYMRKLFTRMAESAPAALKKQLCDLQPVTGQHCGKKLYGIWGSECQCNLNHEPCSPDSSFKKALPFEYEEFLHWLRDYLYLQLRPGANFPRRVTTLNLLYAIHDTFSDSIPIVYSATVAQTLLDVLKDTYENNKQLSLKLLCFKDACKFCLQDGKLIDAAMDLASSSKPPDTVTAAYLFAYMVECDTMFTVLHRYLPEPPWKLLSWSSPLNPMPNMRDKLDVLYNTTLFLMYKLHLQLKVAKNNLLEAVVHAPLYGILACIRNVLKNDISIKDEPDILMWQKLISDLIDLCKEVVLVVEGVLCSSSPEGYIPEHTNDGKSSFEFLGKLPDSQVSALQEGDKSLFQNSAGEREFSAICESVKCQARTAQVVLLCCWRAHKEVSLLLGDISEKLPIVEDIKARKGLLKTEQMTELGNFFIQQMTLVKHKGAFEQAYVGFSKLCHRLWRCYIPELMKLPEKWLFDLIEKVDSKSSEEELCSTRRSAGLPFIVQGLLTSEPSVANSTVFKKSMSILLTLATPKNVSEIQVTGKKDNSSQIHALNILRTLFRDATLSEAVMPFVSTGFIKAIEGFKSQDWGVRNSSNLLFSALMTRMFGVNRSHDETGKKNKLSGKTFVSFYKVLYNYLFEELKDIAHSFYDKGNVSRAKISIQPSLYPILLILGRLYQANGVKDQQLSSFIPYLQTCACSPIWKTRDMAAKALVSIIPQEKVISFLQLTIDTLPKHKTDNFLQNSIHGQLLQILYLLREFSTVCEAQMDSVKSHLQSWFNSSTDIFLRFNDGLSTRAVFLEIYLFAMSLDITLDINVLDKLTIFLWNELKLELDPALYPNLDDYTVIVTTVLLLEMLRMNDEDLSTIYKSHQSLTFIIKDFFQISKNVAIATVFEILFWLLKDDFEDDKHYLDISEDFIEFQRVTKSLRLLDKRKFYSFKHLNFSELCKDLEKFWNCCDGPLFMKQTYNISVVMPSLTQKLIESKDITELQEKLKYAVNKIEVSTSDEEAQALILFSTNIFVAFCQEFKVGITCKTLTDRKSFSEPYEKWLMVIEKTANPDSSMLLRQAAISVLQLLCTKSLFPKSELLDSRSCYLWQALLLLLTDDEPEIKQKASELVVKMASPYERYGGVSSVVPSKAVELMLSLFIEEYQTDPSDSIYNEVLCRLCCEKFSCHPASLNGCIYTPLLDQRNCVSMMLNWMLSSKAVSPDSMNDEQPFDKGEMNVYSEDLTLTDIVSKYLVKYLEHHKEERWIFPLVISCWRDKFHQVMTYEDAIITCLDECCLIINNLAQETNLPVISDTYFDLGLIEINQRLSAIISLLPFLLESGSNKEQCPEKIREPAMYLYQKIDILPFKTLFVKTLMKRLKAIVNLSNISDVL